MTRFWISWTEPALPDEDPGEPEFVELVFGGTTEIVRAWIRGWTMRDYKVNLATVCAVIDAEDETSARRIVKRSYRPLEWRFCHARPADWMPPVDKFP